MVQGKLFVLSAPSGTGKTTILRKVMADVSGLCFSVSHTTRSPRQGEVDGKDYHFVSRVDFEQQIGSNQFIEWAEVHGNLYGTSLLGIQQQQSQGLDVILDIDTQGAAIIREKQLVSAVDLFVAPPSLAILEQRLRGRGTETEEQVELRLANGRKEMQQAHAYTYLIVNDDLSHAVEMIKGIILAERAKDQRGYDGKIVDLG